MKLQHLILLFCLLLGFVSCDSNQLTIEDSTINPATIKNFDKIEELNQLIIENIETIGDSCCRHSKTCDYTGEEKLKMGVPLNKKLARRYLGSVEPRIEELIDEMIHGAFQSNEYAFRGNISVGFDSTIRYNCYSRMYSDTVVSHQLIFSRNPKVSRRADVELLLQKLLQDNWTYQIIKYRYER
jgi:hypothetical protein